VASRRELESSVCIISSCRLRLLCEMQIKSLICMLYAASLITFPCEVNKHFPPSNLHHLLPHAMHFRCKKGKCEKHSKRRCRQHCCDFYYYLVVVTTSEKLVSTTSPDFSRALRVLETITRQTHRKPNLLNLKANIKKNFASPTG
jgi:hypothetical protein